MCLYICIPMPNPYLWASNIDFFLLCLYHRYTNLDMEVYIKHLFYWMRDYKPCNHVCDHKIKQGNKNI